MNGVDLLDMGVDPDDDGVTYGGDHPGYSGLESLSYAELLNAADLMFIQIQQLEQERDELRAQLKAVPVDEIRIFITDGSAVAEQSVSEWLNEQAVPA